MSPSRLKRSQRRVRRAAVRAWLRPKLPEQLLTVWDHACWVFANFCEFVATPRRFADREYIATWEYRDIQDWLRQLELLTRRLILAAALAINITLKPLTQTQRKPRHRRRVLVWPDRPRTWIVRFRMLPKRPPEEHFTYHTRRVVPPVLPSMPLARRLEAVRRVLADPDRRAHRFAAKLARIAARNAKANAPRLFRVRPWRLPRIMTRGQRFIFTGMKIVMPIIEDALDRWNQACDPG